MAADSQTRRAALPTMRSIVADMKTLVTLFTVAMLTTAAAQYPPLPKTINLHDTATKEPLGTATFSDNRIYLRDKNGEHYATIEYNADGTRTMYDASGKVIAAPRK